MVPCPMSHVPRPRPMLYVQLTAVNSGGTRRARQDTGSASWKNVWEKIAWWKWYSSGLPGLPSKGWLKHPLVAGRLEVWILLQGTQDPGQSLCSGKEKNDFSSSLKSCLTVLLSMTQPSATSNTLQSRDFITEKKIPRLTFNNYIANPMS